LAVFAIQQRRLAAKLAFSFTVLHILSLGGADESRTRDLLNAMS
jgi:hypothetical protein